MKLSYRKYWIYALLTFFGSIVLLAGGFLAVDLYLHKKFGQVAGFNHRGYRGPVAGKKKLGEQRVVVLGGSTALGYGVPWEESFPRQLDQKINMLVDEGSELRPRIINLAWNNEGAYSYFFTLQDYVYLDYDLVIFYTGYNDLRGFNRTVFRRQSPIFRLTGYLPIFPLIFKEKAMALRFGGNLDKAYYHVGQKIVFKPNLAERGTASALEAAVRINHALEAQLGRLTPRQGERPNPYAAVIDASEKEWWEHYCQSLNRAIRYCLDQNKSVIVVSQPYLSDLHVEQQRMVVEMLTTHFKGEQRLRYVNLGYTLDLKDASLAYDGMHLTALGNECIAEELVQPVLEMSGAQNALPQEG